jgi:hypothetical protein
MWLATAFKNHILHAIQIGQCRRASMSIIAIFRITPAKQSTVTAVAICHKMLDTPDINHVQEVSLYLTENKLRLHYKEKSFVTV